MYNKITEVEIIKQVIYRWTSKNLTAKSCQIIDSWQLAGADTWINMVTFGRVFWIIIIDVILDLLSISLLVEVKISIF